MGVPCWSPPILAKCGDSASDFHFLPVAHLPSSDYCLPSFLPHALQLCKRYPGFMRVALSDPQPERR